MARKQRMLIVHDWLNVKDGGAELVLYELLDMYPDADVATLIYNKRMFGSRLKGRKVQTSILQRFPSYLKRRPHMLLPWVRRAVESLDTRGYDIVLAASSAWVKNISLQPSQHCIIYCHSPARMLWDSWPQAMNRRTHNSLVRLFITNLASKLRLWDYYESQSDQREFIANSQTVAERIKKFYHRTSKVIVPPVELPPTIAADKQGYWVVVSVLSAYKQIDLAIQACLQRKERLIIVGDGPDRARLTELADGSDLIEFRGRVDETEKWRLISAARGFLFCSVEDFGIAPVESMGCGTPVVALRAGGVAETVVDGETGVFYSQPSVEALRAAMTECTKRTWNTDILRKRADKYRPAIFRKRLQVVVGGNKA